MLVLLLSVMIKLFLQLDASVCPEKCDCSLKDEIRCSGPHIKDLESLNLPCNMTKIHITNTQVTSLQDTFSRMLPLQILILASNNISVISPLAFKGLHRLKALKLLDNKLVELPEEVFDDMESLQQLIMENNRLTRIGENLFGKLASLRELFLNKNQLTALPRGALRKLARLEVLNLSRNNLAALPSTAFSALTRLQKLMLYFNQLSSIESGLFDSLKELLELFLHSNNIQAIAPDAFHCLGKLRVLTLSRNKLERLPSGLFLHLPNLSKLTLYRNPLKSLPEVLFGEMRNLGSLWLYHTQLSTLPDFVFSNLTNLELLVLSFNLELSVLPKNVFSGLIELQGLSLHTTNISSLPEGIFLDLHKLQNISIYDSRLEFLPSNLFHNLKHLQKVYLNSTKLQSLPGDLFTALPELQEVFLDNNPWKCNCQILGFQEWLRKSADIVRRAQSLMCDSPPALKNISLMALRGHHMNCLPTTAALYEALGSSAPSPTSTSLRTGQPRSTSAATITAVPSTDANAPTSKPLATLGFTYSRVGGAGRPHSPAVPAQTSPRTAAETNDGGVDLTTPAWWEELPARRSAEPHFNTIVPYCQFFLCLHSLILAVQVVTVVITLYMMCKTRQFLCSKEIPAQPVVLIKIIKK
ncbi:GPV protein, partial [Eudromia elegans]|nr:GPV protein [Eudromia elegans]